jgi:hypothetical protein
MKIFSTVLLAILCLCAKKPEDKPVIVVSPIETALCGIFQAKYTDSSTSEREFTSSHGYILRDYNNNSRLIYTIFGNWLLQDSSKVIISVDSSFMLNPCTFQKTPDLNASKSYHMIFKNLTNESIEFFCTPTDSSPSDWEYWKKII